MNKFLIACLVIYTLGTFSQMYYADSIDYMTLTEQEARIEWYLKAFRDLGLALFIGGSIIWSIWSYKGAQNKRKAKWGIAFSLCLGLAFSLGTGYVYSKYSALVEKRQTPLLSNNPKITKGFEDYLDSQVHSIQERHENSLWHGSTVFIESGKRIQVMGAQGNKVIYQPTEEDIQWRQKEERLVVIEQHAAQSLKVASYTWLIVTIVSLFIGLVAIGGRNVYHKRE
jgi:hypothetical protein